MLVFGLIREDAFKIASVAAHDWSMMQDGDIHLLDLQRAKMRKNKVESHRLLSQQSLFDKSQNFYTMSGMNLSMSLVKRAMWLTPSNKVSMRRLPSVCQETMCRRLESRGPLLLPHAWRCHCQ